MCACASVIQAGEPWSSTESLVFLSGARSGHSAGTGSSTAAFVARADGGRAWVGWSSRQQASSRDVAHRSLRRHLRRQFEGRRHHHARQEVQGSDVAQGQQQKTSPRTCRDSQRQPLQRTGSGSWEADQTRTTARVVLEMMRWWRQPYCSIYVAADCATLITVEIRKSRLSDVICCLLYCCKT